MATATKDKPQEDKAQPEIKGSGRSASYPWIDLAAAEKRAEEFWKVEKTYEAPLTAAFKHWGYGPKSSGARLTIAAMLNYGLMSDRGSNENRMVKLTPLGVDLMMAPNEEAKAKARKSAAHKPRVFSELLKTMDPENLPSDQTIAHFLVTQKGFNPNGAETFIKNFRATIKHAQLKKSDAMSSGQFTVTPDNDHGTGLQGKVVNLAEVSAAASAGTQGAAKPAMAPRGFKQDVYNFADGGQVILQWPEGMSAESFEEFKDWIALQVRKISRAVGTAEKKDE